MFGVVVIAVVGPLAVSLLLTLAVRSWARGRAFVDHPSGHKQHRAPVALGGGIAVTASIVLPLLAGTALAWLLQGPNPPAWLPAIVRTHLEGMASKAPIVLAIVGSALVLHVVGLIDDRKALGPAPKLLAQVAVALFTAWPVGIRAVEILPAPLSVLLTVLWIVLITNAFNFLDNMDGLSAGVAAIAAALFAIASMNAGQIFVPVMAWLVVGAVLGFLPFNFAPASIFMGDAGSLVVGYLMSVLTILTTFYDPAQNLTPLGVIVPLVVLAVPLYDVTSVVIHRLRAGDSPFRGDRRHFSHRLVKRGLTPHGAVLTIYLATAATGLPAIVLPRVGWGFAWLLLVQCLCVVAMIAILEHTGFGSQGGGGSAPP
jgi:UDP-GlcNAc:undecaprenyl-phosphate GlcNAc-1-phosphate transferase